MPSGTHGRSPFGSGSLNSRSFGSSRSSRTSRSTRRYYNGSRIYVFGHRSFYVTSSKKALVQTLSVLAWILFFVTLFSGLSTMISSSNADSAKDDYNYYQDMIVQAKASPNLIQTAYVRDFQYDYDSEKYYLEYEITYTTGEKDWLGELKKFVLEGISYPVYDIYQARDLQKTYIDVAIDKAPVDETTDSVPIDFAGYELEDIYEYTSAKTAHKNSLIVMIVAGSLFAVSLVGYIVAFKNSLREVEDTHPYDETPSETPALRPENEPSSEPWKCNYCGGMSSGKSSKCENCGASRN